LTSEVHYRVHNSLPMAPILKISCEYIEKNSGGQPAWGGPPACVLGEELRTSHRKKNTSLRIVT